MYQVMTPEESARYNAIIEKLTFTRGGKRRSIASMTKELKALVKKYGHGDGKGKATKYHYFLASEIYKLTPNKEPYMGMDPLMPSAFEFPDSSDDTYPIRTNIVPEYKDVVRDSKRADELFKPKSSPLGQFLESKKIK